MPKPSLNKAVLLGAMLGAIAFAGAARSEAVSQGCSAAYAVVPQTKDDELPPFFSDPVRRGGLHLTAADMAAGWSGRTPKRATIEKYRRAPPGSALNCSNVRKLAGDRGRIVTHREGRSELERMGLVPGKTKYLYQISMPVISDDGQEAIVEITSSSNHLFGGVVLLMLARSSDGWTIVGRRAVLLG